MIFIIQSFVHEQRRGSYPIEKITMKAASICADKEIRNIRIKMDSDTIGILHMDHGDYDSYIDQLNDIFSSGDENRILDMVNWSIYNEYPRRIFLPLLREFYTREKKQYEREIHDLSNGFPGYMLDVALSMHWTQMMIGLMSGSAGLQYSD